MVFRRFVRHPLRASVSGLTLSILLAGPSLRAETKKSTAKTGDAGGPVLNQATGAGTGPGIRSPDNNATIRWIAPIYGQLLSFSFPREFKSAYAKANGPSYIQESVPEGETVDEWTQMITVTGVKGLASKPDFSPKKFAEDMAGRMKGRCPNSFSAASIFDGKIGGHDAFAAVLSCGTSPLAAGHNESFLVTVIKGDSDYYTVQWAERAEVSSTPIAIDTARWLERFKKLGPIKLCQIVPGEAAPYSSCVDSNASTK